MINHVRTLLMNHGREGYGLDTPGEEYIPSNFLPRNLSPLLASAHRALFGGNPDRLFLNYRLRQIMAMMHATPMSDDILADDKRITYLPFRQDLFDDLFKVTVKTLAGVPDHPPKLVGRHDANMSEGIIQQIWDVTITGTGVANIVKRRNPISQVTLPFDNDNPLPLMGTEMVIFLTNPTPGYKFRISSNARPTVDIAETLRHFESVLGQRGVEDLFPVAEGEPVKTWLRIWNEHPATPMRYTALLLAFARRIGQMPFGDA